LELAADDVSSLIKKLMKHLGPVAPVSFKDRLPWNDAMLTAAPRVAGGKRRCCRFPSSVKHTA
jgi:hypothetical protein